MWVRRIGAKLRRQLETEGVMIDKTVLGEISANTYRHQWAANSKEALPLEKVAESMGHASALTASRYAKSTRAKGPYRPLAAYTNKPVSHLDKLGRPAELGAKAKANKPAKSFATVIEGGVADIDAVMDELSKR